MKRKILSMLPLILILVLSACGGGATPAVNLADMQNTAIANAWLAMTQTQAALPTATATFTPAPTETPAATFVMVPTLPSISQPTLMVPAGNPTTDPCNEPPPLKPTGTLVQVKFVNKSEGGLSLSFGMVSPNAQGECGTYAFSMGKFDAPVVTVLAGCYWAYAYIDKPATSSTPPGKSLCVYDATKAVAIWITAEVIGFH